MRGGDYEADDRTDLLFDPETLRVAGRCYDCLGVQYFPAKSSAQFTFGRGVQIRPSTPQFGLQIEQIKGVSLKILDRPTN